MPDLTAAQHALRKTRVGASEVGALLGPHPWTDPARIYDRIVNGSLPGRQTPAMAAGHALERAIGRHAAATLGLRVRACSRTYVHPTLPLAASPDFYADTGTPFLDWSQGLLEVKLSRDWSDWLDGPPPWYEWQVRAQLALTDRPWGYIGALVGTSIQTHRIDRDLPKERQLLAAVHAFNEEHLALRNPPPTDDERLTLRWSLGPGDMIATDVLEQAGNAYAAAVLVRREADGIEGHARAAFVDQAAAEQGKRLILGNGWSAKIDERGTLRFDVKNRG